MFQRRIYFWKLWPHINKDLMHSNLIWICINLIPRFTVSYSFYFHNQLVSFDLKIFSTPWVRLKNLMSKTLQRYCMELTTFITNETLKDQRKTWASRARCVEFSQVTRRLLSSCCSSALLASSKDILCLRIWKLETKTNQKTLETCKQ